MNNISNIKEFKVKLKYHENDDYNELYKVIDENQYFIRHTYGEEGTWCFVSDPLGYCELDRSCPDDYTFIVCDQKGNELFRDSNSIEDNFPTLEGKARMEWVNIKDNYPIKKGLNDWLKSFITEELKNTTLKNEYCIYDNWTAFWYDQIDKTPICDFSHLGEEYCIYEVKRKHRYCDCEWVEYMAGSKHMGEYEGYIEYFGSNFPDEYGDAYSPNEAREIVISTLKEIYGDKKTIRTVHTDWGMCYERQHKMYDAATMLIKNNYDKKHISEVIENERNNNTFYSSYAEIKAEYPQCTMDCRVLY